MRKGPSAPKQLTWFIALILGLAGILGTLTVIPVISGIAFWLVVAGWALLLIATVIRDL